MFGTLELQSPHPKNHGRYRGITLARRDIKPIKLASITLSDTKKTYFISELKLLAGVETKTDHQTQKPLLKSNRSNRTRLIPRLAHVLKNITHITGSHLALTR